MRAPAVNAFLLMLAVSAPACAATPVVPTTTLTAETSNNTSASSSFQAKPDGDIAPTNISKVATSTLIYKGFSSPIYAHFQPWFGGTNHMDVGYTSDDPTQVHKQVSDMMSRGLAGMIIDWYGPSSVHENGTSILVMDDAETRGGKFAFAIFEDVGALKACAAKAGCDVTQQMISDLNYVYTEFEPSPAYMRVGGRPVIGFFGVDAYTINWPLVRTSVKGNPLFLNRNSGGFTHAETGGAYSWVGIASTPTGMGLSYLDNFYTVGLQHSAEYAVGSGYKGFNDTLAAWGKNRIVDQQCGQTWIDTLAEAGKFYSSSNPLDAVQLVTWNDYEEGTEIETGIDNCVTVAATLSGSTVNWAIAGNENTLDHYTVYISPDGENLMPVQDVAAGTHALDLAPFVFTAGSYTVFVKAVGRPGLVNHMTNGVAYTSGGNQPPVVDLAVTGNFVMPAQVTANTAGTHDPDGSIASESINFGDGTVVSVSAGGKATHTYSATGSYTITATATDNGGLSRSAQKNITVVAPYVAIGEPLNNSYVTPNARVAAAAFSGNPIKNMQIYVDGSMKYEISAASLDTVLALAAGAHNLTVKAWDTSGNFSSAVSVKVNVRPCFLAPALTPLGPDATIGTRFLPCLAH